jgi:hypothetical protein
MANGETKEFPVVVTTEKRGVFFGFTTEVDKAKMCLRDARLCVYWSADCKGFMGLAAKGPTKNCKIGPPANITVFDITSVAECTPEAVAAWEAAPWAG